MKFIIAIITIASLLAGGCKKSTCYVCDRPFNQGGTKTFCKSDTNATNKSIYNDIAGGGVVTDAGGSAMHCAGE